MGEYTKLIERAATRYAEPELSMEGLLLRRDRKRRNQRVIAGIVGIAVFVTAVWIVTTGGPFDRGQQLVPGGAGTGPAVTGPPAPTGAPIADDIVGLPSIGAAPSIPEHGRLVLYMEGGFVGGPWTAIRVYADGRVIWGDVGGYLPPGAPTDGATGFVEQKLTPAWVEFLQADVLSTGLFEHDLGLLLDRTGFLTIEARNGDRLVSATWAVEENYRVGPDAPTATPEQASALEGIYALLSDPASWPASAWEDEDPKTFVPTRYHVWLRVFPDQGDGPPLQVGERELGLLPTAAADILRQGTPVDRATYELTTDDVRTFAEAFIEAGLQPWPSPMGEAVLRFTLEDPEEPGYSLWVFVAPVLPHGEAIALGPG